MEREGRRESGERGEECERGGGVREKERSKSVEREGEEWERGEGRERERSERV